MRLDSTAGLLALLTLPGIGSRRAQQLASSFGTWQALTAAAPTDLASALRYTKTTALIERLADAITPEPPPATIPSGVRVLSLHDDSYPDALRTIDSPPVLLWVRGTVPTPNTPMLAVVGTRRPTDFGTGLARTAARDSAERGIGVVSGLADGIDSTAHAAALDANGPTWAYLGQGLDTLDLASPRGQLAARILDNGGGLLAEVACGTPVAAGHLITRNRLQSGTSHATLICQSEVPDRTGRGAGTMHTARYALRQGRTLAVGRPVGRWATETASSGNLALTDPDGCDPSLLHASDDATRALIAQRRPVADVILRDRTDLATFLDTLT